MLNLRGDNVVDPHILVTDFFHLVAQRENLAFQVDSECQRLLVNPNTKTLVSAQLDKKYYYEGEEVKVWIKVENIHSKSAIDSFKWMLIRKLQAVSKAGLTHDQSETIIQGVYPAICGSAQTEEFVMNVNLPICDYVDLSSLDTDLHPDE